MPNKQSHDVAPMSTESSVGGKMAWHDLTEMVMQLKASILSLPLPPPPREKSLMTLEQQMQAFTQEAAPLAPVMPEPKPLKLLCMRPAGRSESLGRLNAATPCVALAGPVQEDPPNPSLDLAMKRAGSSGRSLSQN